MHTTVSSVMTADGIPEVPLIAHIIYRLDTGGLENGLVNLINRIPETRFRHAIICLTDYSEFRKRIQRSDVQVFSLNKPPGHSSRTYLKLWRLLKHLRPEIVHTRNLAALECMLPAALAGVRLRIHGEHGRDVSDPDGLDIRYQLWRKAFKPFVHHYIAVSKDLADYVRDKVGVPATRLTQVYNGVDTEIFYPGCGAKKPLPGSETPFSHAFVIGTVGRMQAVKDPLNLARAFIKLVRMVPPGCPLRLVMVGDGPLRAQVMQVLEEGGVRALAWVPGERHDVAQIMRSLDLFVLPSLAEGISNTILEAMATGLPVVATAVGGNSELVRHERTGCLVPRADPEAMAGAMLRYCTDTAACRRQGSEARAIAERDFSMSAMVRSYVGVYDQMLKRQRAERDTPTCAES